MFILNRLHERDTRSKWSIIRYGLLFWIVTRLLCMVLMVVCASIYMLWSVNPRELTQFGGDPAYLLGQMGPLRIALLLLVFAPLIEETLFRLGLSFRRIHAALAAAALPVFFTYRCASPIIGAVGVAAALLFFAGVWFLTTDRQWARWRERGLRPAVWITAILFGLAHLKAFTVLNFTTLPFVLCLCCVPFFVGCVCTYYRVNLGFWWGVAAHVVNNIPPVILMILMLKG